jgi:hypothetical protein
MTFVRLTLTNLDWVSTVRGHTMFPLNCVQNIKWLSLTISNSLFNSCVMHNVSAKLNWYFILVFDTQ